MLLTRLLSVSCCLETDVKGPERVTRNRQMMADVLDAASAFRPDFVVFPELCLQMGAAPMAEALCFAEPVPGPSTDAIAAKAADTGAYVWLPMFEKQGDRTYNSVVLIGRDGGIVGTYRKYHATGYEILDGVTPGDEVPVWQTDRGRVGCAVCFDLKFPIVGLTLSRGKAQIVFWPTMFEGGRRMAAWAMDYGFYLVRSFRDGGAVIDPNGCRIASPGVPMRPIGDDVAVRWTFAEVNADRKTYHTDYNTEKLPDIIGKYGGGVSVWMNEPEASFNLACNLPDKRVEDIEEEFALEDLRDYLDGAAKVRDEHLPS